MKILIAIPTFENIMPDTYKSVWDLDKAGHECLFEFVRGYDCATARNRIAQLALDTNVDYVLMVDNDVVLPKDALVNLLDDVRDVQLGFYAHRTWKDDFAGKTSVCKLGEKNYTMQFTVDELRKLNKPPFKVQIHGGGMGCALIKTEIFRRLSYPWYDWVNYANAHRGMLSEDLFFCEKCRIAGIPIYTDTRVACGHMMRYIQNAD